MVSAGTSEGRFGGRGGHGPVVDSDHEASAGSTLHDNGLQVLQANCHDDGIDKFLCEVTFISKGDPERPYFDIVAVARAGEGWELKSGLCKP